MAFSITQSPHEVVAVNSPIIYICKETTPAIVNNDNTLCDIPIDPSDNLPNT